MPSNEKAGAWVDETNDLAGALQHNDVTRQLDVYTMTLIAIPGPKRCPDP